MKRQPDATVQISLADRQQLIACFKQLIHHKRAAILQGVIDKHNLSDTCTWANLRMLEWEPPAEYRRFCGDLNRLAVKLLLGVEFE